MDALFGSETRARLLEQLATTPIPQSAYRIARAIGAEPIQVLKILKQLNDLTERSADGWVLTNELLRRFLRDRLTHDAEQIRREKDELLVYLGMKPSWKHGRRQVRRNYRIGP
jgi:hypothetical protein